MVSVAAAAGAARGCAPLRTYSIAPFSTPARTSRSATTSACTACPWCYVGNGGGYGYGVIGGDAPRGTEDYGSRLALPCGSMHAYIPAFDSGIVAGGR